MTVDKDCFQNLGITSLFLNFHTFTWGQSLTQNKASTYRYELCISVTHTDDNTSREKRKGLWDGGTGWEDEDPNLTVQ